MKLWNIVSPYDYQYAQASRVGTWIQQGDPPQSTRIRPAVIEWEPSSTTVGDFTISLDAKICTLEVATELQKAGFKAFELSPVVMAPNSEHKNQRKNLIQLPYSGPELVELWPTKNVAIDIARSTVTITPSDYGPTPSVEVLGIERIEHGKWDPIKGSLERIRVPRTPGKGIYIKEHHLCGCDFFQLAEPLGGPVCTDRFRDFVLEKEYTNIDFFEIGEVLECPPST